MSGKWHLGDERDSWPRQRDFDRYFGLISGATSFFELLQEAGRGRLMLLENTPWTPPSSGYYATDAYTDYAVERIREHRTAHASQPFFMYVAYTAPHFPLHALPEDIARTSGGTTRLCGNEQSSHSGILWGERVCHPSAGQHQRVDPAAE